MRKTLPWLVLAAILAYLAYKLHTSPFDYANFLHSLSLASLPLLLAATACIYANNLFRALRWAIFLKPTRTATPWYSLIGAQFVGFTGLAIFGRLGELIRPILIARRTALPISSQIAVLTVERVFDLAAFGTIFAVNLIVSPTLQRLPYLHKVGYTIAALTAAIILFVLTVRLAGPLVARITQRALTPISPTAAGAAADKILAFRQGLDVIETIPDFLAATVLSFALWLDIACAYLLTLKAFPAPVHTLTFGHTIVLMGFSIAGSALPIPGGGGAWAGNVFALTHLLGIPAALAAAAGLTVWLVTNLSIIPGGLLFARAEGTSLTQLAHRSEAEEA